MQCCQHAEYANLETLRRGDGNMAQFSRAAFCGLAQWPCGGMSVLGDMFNDAMKSKLNGVLVDPVATLASFAGSDRVRRMNAKASRASTTVEFFCILQACQPP